MATFDSIMEAYLDRRAKVQITVGEYLLTLDPRWMLFDVSRPDGKAIPKGLQGKWREVSQFRAQAEKILGPSYSLEGLRKVDPLRKSAIEAGIDPKSITLDGKPEKKARKSKETEATHGQ